MSNSEITTIDQLAIKVELKRDTMELFTIPFPRHQQVLFSKRSAQIRLLDNPLEESLRRYVAWGKLRL